MSVLGLDSGYTVKYTPPPSGGGVYLTVHPSSRPNTDTVYYIQLKTTPKQFQTIQEERKTVQEKVKTIQEKLETIGEELETIQDNTQYCSSISLLY